MEIVVVFVCLIVVGIVMVDSRIDIGGRRERRALADRAAEYHSQWVDEKLDTSCRLWEIRQTQTKMVEAGILTEEDMSLCNNKNCTDCKRTCHIVKRNGENRVLEARIKEFNSKKESDDTYNVDGFACKKPRIVPPAAHAAYQERTRRIRWTWIDPDTGRKMIIDSLPMVDVEADYQITNGDGAKVPIPYAYLPYDKWLAQQSRRANPIMTERIKR